MTKTTLKWTKRAVLVLAIIPILIFLAFAGAVSLIDFNQYKPQIEQEVYELTNREFKIDGTVEVSVLPFMFHVGNMKLKNSSGYAQEHLLTMKEAQIELSLKKLFLEKQLKIISLELIEPKLHFIQTLDRNNWSDIPLLAQAFPPETMAQLRYAKVNPDEALQGLMSVSNNEGYVKPTPTLAPIINEDWSLESLVIKNAEISYTHKVQDFTISLKDANLLTLDIVPNRAFKINSDFRYEHSQSPRAFDFQINGHLLLANNYSQWHLTNWNGVFRLQLPKERNLPDIRLTTSGSNLMLDFRHQQIYVNEAILQGLNAEVALDFQGEFGADPAFEGTFAAKQINIKKWVERLGLPAPEMVKPDALSEAGGKFNWHWNGKVLKLQKLEAELDDSKVSGELTIPFDADKSVQFDLVLQDLDVNHYLAKTAQPQSTRPGDSDTFLPIPVSFLQDLNAQGRLSIDNFRLYSIDSKRVTLELFAEQGNIMLAPLDLTFAEGEVQSKFNADIASSQPKYQWKGRVKQLALAQFTAQDKQVLTGQLDSHFALRTQGANSGEWLANLAGTINARIDQAQLSGLDLNQMLSGKLQLGSEQVATQFQELQVNGRFQQGVFTPKRLLALSERFKGSGNGQLDLRQQQVKGQLALTIDKPSSAMAELKGLTLPLAYQGSMYQPEWSIDVAQLSPAALKQSPVLSALKTLAN